MMIRPCYMFAENISIFYSKTIGDCLDALNSITKRQLVKGTPGKHA